MKLRMRTIGLASALVLVLAACASDDSADSTTTTAAEATETTESTEAMGDTIVDVASANEDFSTLVAAVQAADLVDALADPDATLTVFAPTNAAFEAALADLGLTAEELLADTETLTAILTYHVLGEEVTSGDIISEGTEEVTVSTLSGEDLTIVVTDEGTVRFADQTATVTSADVEASNGVIHVIDAVLLPPSMSS